MFFCPKCDNGFYITKNLPDVNNINKQDGGDKNITSSSESSLNPQEIVDKIINQQKINKADYENINLDDIIKSNSYKKLTTKDKELVYNTVNDNIGNKIKKDLEDKPTKAKNPMHFICKNCGYHEPIKGGTMIISKSDVKTNVGENKVNASDYIKVKYFPRTRNYACPNKSCESIKNAEKRSAVFFREQNSFKVKYICETCEEQWLN